MAKSLIDQILDEIFDADWVGRRGEKLTEIREREKYSAISMCQRITVRQPRLICSLSPKKASSSSKAKIIPAGFLGMRNRFSGRRRFPNETKFSFITR